ncbi:MAG: FliA/WhiG family RNA polymerase sigma factor [Desulfobacterales bacterium]|nr:FliA/WhiG family RNA polymerase sigma factor [Desulfobacterales bacterium]MBF0396182.1 FliA/WhiG family RNA polymerase sigma factor [Desulfobacterales bacterium]
MIIKYSYLVKYIAGRIAVKLPANILLDELISAGSIGLIDAVDKFDPNKNVSLKTYAEYRIRGAIIDELRTMDWYSRSMRKKIQDIEHALHKIETREGRTPKDSEVAESLGISVDEYYKTLADVHSIAIVSLDEFIKDEDNESFSKRSFNDSIKSEENISEKIEYNELKQAIAASIGTLSKKEQLVVSLYYYDELTLKEIGQVLDLTESRICQIHSMAIIKLKAKIKKYVV